MIITAHEHQYNMSQLKSINEMLTRRDLGDVTRQMLVAALKEFHDKRKAYEAQTPACCEDAGCPNSRIIHVCLNQDAA